MPGFRCFRRRRIAGMRVWPEEIIGSGGVLLLDLDAMNRMRELHTRRGRGSKQKEKDKSDNMGENEHGLVDNFGYHTVSASPSPAPLFISFAFAWTLLHFTWIDDHIYTPENYKPK